MAFDLSVRASGVLLHPTSLPGAWGCGDLGSEAHSFARWLRDAGQRYWQMLPVGPVGYGNSPYSALSAFAGNPLLISLERLVERGWLKKDRLNTLPSDVGPVDFELVRTRKFPLLQEAAQNFLNSADAAGRERFE